MKRRTSGIFGVVIAVMLGLGGCGEKKAAQDATKVRIIAVYDTNQIPALRS